MLEEDIPYHNVMLSYGEDADDAHGGCVKPSVENVCLHNMRNGSEPHLT